MKSVKLLAVLGLVALSAPARGQLFNEIYGRHDGNDDQEYIEIRGLPGNSLDGFVVVIVEGEYPNAGYIDRAWDLTGMTVPADGFFLLGVNATGPDMSIGNSNRIENGTQTIYLVQVADPSLILGAVGTVDLDPDDDGVTSLAGFANIFDSVALVDRDYVPGGTPGSVDEVFDGATVIGPMPELGPDLNDFPTGVFREGDAPNPWCLDTFLDYYDEVNTDKPRTPGVSNTAICDGNSGGGGGDPIGVAYCFGDGSAGACPCANTGSGSSGCANSTGSGSTIVATGSASISADNLLITASNLPPSNAGLYYCGTVPLPTGNVLFDGIQCVSVNVRRFAPAFQSTGTATDTGFVAQEGSGLYFVSGNNYAFQYWGRDANGGSPCGANANFSNSLWILFTP